MSKEFCFVVVGCIAGSEGLTSIVSEFHIIFDDISFPSHFKATDFQQEYRFNHACSPPKLMLHKVLRLVGRLLEKLAHSHPPKDNYTPLVTLKFIVFILRGLATLTDCCRSYFVTKYCIGAHEIKRAQPATNWPIVDATENTPHAPVFFESTHRRTIVTLT